ncbi:putative lipopolysaccharide heptosyltransferase III [Desulfobacca acetoxidans]
MNFRDLNKILVIKLRQLGDVLLTVPVFRALREHFPHAHIAALVNSGTEGMLARNPLLDEIIVLNRKNRGVGKLRKWRNELTFLRDIRRSRFDLTVDLSSGDRAAIMSFLSGARYRIGTDLCRVGFWGKPHLYTLLATNDGSRHIVLQNLNVVGQFGITTDNARVDFFIPPAALGFVNDLFCQRRFRDSDIIIHVHPTSAWLFKCWRDEAMAELIHWLLDQGIKVILTSAPNVKELSKAKAIVSAIPSSAALDANLINLCGQTDVDQLAAISGTARLFFGVDSMPMHLAAAVGTPVLALFGPSILHRWAPWSEAMLRITSDSDYQRVYRNGAYHLGIHTVIQRDWECVPCRRDGCDGSKRSRCLEDITVEEVKKMILKTIPS